LTEFKTDLNHYPNKSNAQLKTLQQAIKLNKQFAGRTMPIFTQDIFIKARAAQNLDEEAYLSALKNSKQQTSALGINATLAKQQLDLLITPTNALRGKLITLMGAFPWLSLLGVCGKWISAHHCGHGQSKAPASKY
jgi:hypothetical protein